MEKNLSSLPEIICDTYGYKETDPTSLSPLTLAFIGDSIFDIIVKTKVVTRANAPAKKLHLASSKIVNAGTQAAIIQELMPLLTEEELAIFKRGRNAKSYTSAKNASITDYKAATGFEALVGWLYLKGNMERVYELVLPLIPQYEN